MLYASKLNEVREAAEKIEAAALAVRKLAEGEPQEFPSRYRITELRAISREIKGSLTRLEKLYE